MSTTPSPVLQALQQQFGDAIVATHEQHGDATAVVSADRLVEVLTWLKTDPAWDFAMLMDVGGVDYLTFPVPQPERFCVAYHLYSLSKKHRVRLKVYVSAEDPVVPTATGLWKSADWMEREVWDQYGIRFSGHPNLKRVLNHMEFVGHPLRKDYPITKRQALSINDTLMDEMTAKLKAKGLA